MQARLGLSKEMTAIVVLIIICLALVAGLGYYATQPARTTTVKKVESVTTTLAARTVTLTKTVTVTPAPPAPPKPPTPPPAAPEKIVIGGSLALSGKMAKEGQMSLWGIQSIIKWVNDVYGGVRLFGKKVPIEYKYYDDESKKELVPSLYEKLITVDKVDMLLCPYASSLTITAAPIADKYDKLAFSHGGASDRIFQQGYRYVVQTLSPATKYQTSALDMLKALDPKAKEVAVVFKDAEFTRMVAEGAKKRARELGLNVVFYKPFPPGATDLTPILTEMAAAKPDAVLGATHFADGQLLAKQIGDLKIEVKLLSITVAPALPAFYEALGSMAEGIVYPAQWEVGVKYSPDAAKKLGIEWFGPTQDDFLSLFKSVAGADKIPSYHAAEAGAAVLHVVKAIEAAQSLKSEELRKALNKLDFLTFFGRIKIDPETGLQLGHDMVLGQWQGGKKVIVWPPEAAVGKPYYPMPSWEEKAAGKKAVP